MLSKSQRLNLKTNFKWVASGKRVETSLFKLFYKFGTNTSPLIGVSISGHQFKKANLRNRAKRLSFNAIGEIYSALPTNLNLVIMPKAEILSNSLEELKKELKNVATNNFSN